jgi:site-specific DNA recombinase
MAAVVGYVMLQEPPQCRPDLTHTCRCTKSSGTADLSAWLYLAIEYGVIELDDDIKGRIVSLKERRDIIETSLARITQNIGANVELDSDRIAKFSDLMQRKLDDGDVKTRRTYLSSVIDRVEVDDDAIPVFGRKDVLADAIAGRNSPAENVSGFVRKWRARQDSNLRPQA